MVSKMLRMTYLKSILTAGAVALCVQSASAATILNFTNTTPVASANTGTSMTFADIASGLSVTVAAGQFTSFDGSMPNDTRTVSANGMDLVTQSIRGLGEQRTTGPAVTLPDTNNSINSGAAGSGPSLSLWREALAFSFNKTVRILSVTFYAPTASAAQGFIFSGPTLSGHQLNDDFATATGAAGGNRSLSFASYVGNDFAFGAKALPNSNFFIASMEVEVVPLPAGGLLLVSALAALPFLRRKRRAA